MIAPDDPKTIRDKMIALISEEGRANPDQAYAERLRKEIFHTLDHVPDTFDEYMAWVNPIIAAKQEELSKSKYAEKGSDPELGELKAAEEGEEEKKEEEAEGGDGAAKPTKKKKKNNKKKKKVDGDAAQDESAAATDGAAQKGTGQNQAEETKDGAASSKTK